ncbi:MULTISPECIES: Flp pilus assembly protein CpaB [Rhodomicrobium]|uniref:Flp pilus assembly protein CpaB n=1 Tax=Rhodomicrobium TaxID=1068 RepID=UPI001483ABE2|nr:MULTISPECIES: Flp pilus assembly protein CpaB [Rhodomicrobium]
MRWARGLVLALAAGAAAGSAAIARNAAKAPSPEPRQTAGEVLVLGRAIAAGERVEAGDLRWQPWPAAAIPEAAIARGPGRPAPDFAPGLARFPLLAGEPVAEAKLIRPGDGGAMAASIAPGMRAVAIAMKDESAAGGLIQANDRVDVLWTRQAQNGPPAARTILHGAKVLATGKGGARTATLELTPEQARRLAARRTGGEISLALMATADLAQTASADEADEAPGEPVKIMKFGRQASGSSGDRGPR